MSLADSLPWAIAAGRNAGIANANADIADEWEAYAHKLEKQVEFYKSESQKGWAAYYAAKDIIIDETGEEPKDIPIFSTKMKHYLEIEQAKS